MGMSLRKCFLLSGLMGVITFGLVFVLLTKVAARADNSGHCYCPCCTAPSAGHPNGEMGLYDTAPVPGCFASYLACGGGDCTHGIPYNMCVK